uniref:Uncharacterized protein n=1 Tax=Arundo donax TaxID=35708 RepID=A0A0A9CM95_ARUDO
MNPREEEGGGSYMCSSLSAGHAAPGGSQCMGIS